MRDRSFLLNHKGYKGTKTEKRGDKFPYWGGKCLKKSSYSVSISEVKFVAQASCL